MYPCQSLVVVVVCLASLSHSYVEKLLDHPDGRRRVQRSPYHNHPDKQSHSSLSLLEEEARSLTRLGLVLIVENNSGFTLADQNIYLEDGGQGSQ